MISLLLSLALSLSSTPAPKVVTAEQAGDAYTIHTVLKLVQPYDLQAMNDEFQSAKLVSEAGGVGTFEITYRPYHVQQINADPNWRQDDAKMAEYLRPRLAANWDSELQSQILTDLKADGIDPDNLDDKTLVEKVSDWALKRSSFNNQFGLWMVEFHDGKPVVPKELQPKFTNEEPKDMADDDAFNRELFGAGMYRNKTHGSCTSTSTYMATILRAVGIPTRIIITVPAADANDREQVDKLLNAVRHNKTRHIIDLGMVGHGFSNHVYNEVWVGGKWVRLNYNRLGQPILDPNYFGLMTHIYTYNDFSEVPFSKTWGERFALHSGPKLSSVNPYELVSAKDDLTPNLVLENPPVKQLNHATIIAVVGKDDTRVQGKLPKEVDALFQIREWIPEDNYLQLRAFIRDASREFVLSAPGQPDVVAKVIDFSANDESRGFQAYGVHLSSPLAPGVNYTISPHNGNSKHTWSVEPGVVWKG